VTVDKLSQVVWLSYTNHCKLQLRCRDEGWAVRPGDKLNSARTLRL